MIPPGMEDAGNTDEKHDHTDLPLYMLGLTSRSRELSNYLQYKTKINWQLCSGEGKWVRSSQIL